MAYGSTRYLNPQTAPLLTARPQVLFNYLGRGGESDALRISGGDQDNSPYAVEVNAWTDEATGSLHAAFTLADGVPDTITEHWLAALERIGDASATAERTAPVTPSSAACSSRPRWRARARVRRARPGTTSRRAGSPSTGVWTPTRWPRRWHT